uniref:THAP5 n=1 Tax=Mesocestoides corti TaxID=53468 RepID=A0A5K3G693_MESCO
MVRGFRRIVLNLWVGKPILVRSCTLPLVTCTVVQLPASVKDDLKLNHIPDQSVRAEGNTRPTSTTGPSNIKETSSEDTIQEVAIEVKQDEVDEMKENAEQNLPLEHLTATSNGHSDSHFTELPDFSQTYYCRPLTNLDVCSDWLDVSNYEEVTTSKETEGSKVTSTELMETRELLEKQLRLEDSTPISARGQEMDIQEMQGIEISTCRPAPAKTTQHPEYCNLLGQPVNSISTAAVFEGKQVTLDDAYHVAPSTTMQQSQGKS